MLKKLMLGRLEYKVVAGIGLLSMTREKAEEGVNALVENGEVNPKDAQEMIIRLVQRGEEEKQAIRDMANGEIHNVLEELRFVTKDDLDALREEIKILTHLIAEG